MIVYTDLLQAVIADMAATVEPLRHIDPSRVLAVAANRITRGSTGGLAECVALGIEETPTFEFRYEPRRQTMTAVTPWFRPVNRRIVIDGAEMRYVVRARLPRFADESPARSLGHELLHISERFDGEHRGLRHGPWFRRLERAIESEWLRRGDPDLTRALEMPLSRWRKTHGAIVCRCFRKPLVTPLRLPHARDDGWLEHPEARRLGLRLPAGGPRLLSIDYDDPRDVEWTDRDLEYRIFSPDGSQRIGAAMIPPEARPWPRR